MIATSEVRILLVEDNAESQLAAVADIHRWLPGASIDLATDSETALSMINSSPFDLAICDLKIPARPGAIGTDESHGLAVIGTLQEVQPGTPIIILSAWGTVERLDPFTAPAEVLAILGSPRIPMCQAVVKGVPDAFAQRLEPIGGGIARMATVELVAGDDLDPMLERAITQFASTNGYTRVEVTKAGGLSGASNAIVVMRASGKPSKRLFVKVNTREWLLDEVSRQREYVEGSLDSANWAPTLDLVKVGLRDSAAYFSSLATDPTDLFVLSNKSETRTLEVIDRIEAAVHPWHLPGVQSCTVGDLRRNHLPDSEVASLGFDLSEFEDVESLDVTYSPAVIHGDLHGENVLVVDGTRPVFVDFAYTEVAPAVLDPVTLEMSFLFHPSSPLVVSGRTVFYDRWAEGDYLDHPFQRSIVEKCRSWGLGGRSESEFLAASYAHALRHLKRGQTVSPDHALAVARSAAAGLRH